MHPFKKYIFYKSTSKGIHSNMTYHESETQMSLVLAYLIIVILWMWQFHLLSLKNLCTKVIQTTFMVLFWSSKAPITFLVWN